MGKDLAHLRRQVSDLLRFKAKASIQAGRKVSYVVGDKCGKLLALREQRAYIPHIQGNKGQTFTKPKDIAQVFGEFLTRKEKKQEFFLTRNIWGILLVPI